MTQTRLNRIADPDLWRIDLLESEGIGRIDGGPMPENQSGPRGLVLVAAGP